MNHRLAYALLLMTTLVLYAVYRKFGKAELNLG